MKQRSPLLQDPREALAFDFRRRSFDATNGELELVWGFDFEQGPGPDLVERIQFPRPEDGAWHSVESATLEAAFELLHHIAGVSYYKAGLSARLTFSAGLPEPTRVQFLARLYEHGLGEFSFVNGLAPCAGLQFATAPEDHSPAAPLSLPQRALVALGGGKDSLVSVEWLRRSKLPLSLAAVGQSQLIADTAAASGLPFLSVGRQLAPELGQYNDQGAWNGHVPVTAINSAILLCTALLRGYSQVVFSNERSADAANLERQDGQSVNHQYSKSHEFEQQLRAEVQRSIGAGLEYYSLLRGFGELRLLAEFARCGEAYWRVFSSCNRNFHLDGSRVSGRWCGDCPKCRFTSLGLGLFLPPQAIQNIIGHDLLADPDQLDGFRALCGLGRFKPFECVGTIEESRAAVLALADRAGPFPLVIETLASELAELGEQTPSLQALLRYQGPDNVPATVRSALPRDP